MENSSITVTLKRLSGKVVRSDWQCQNGRELLRELERLDHTAARASWLYKGFPLEEDEILPAQLELQEVLPWRNWKSWDVDENHIQRLDGLAQDPSVRTQHLRVNKYNPPDISILCCEEDDSPTWLYACTYELALCLTSFAWRRLVLELMAFNDLQCRGSRLCRVTQLQQMRRELRKLSELRENAGIHGEGDDCLQATWPFGEASRIEMQEALSKKLMKNQAKRAAESEVDAEVQQRLRTDSADLLCNLAVVLLLQPWPTSLDLQRAYAFLKQSLEMDATMDSQHFLQRALRLLHFHELERVIRRTPGRMGRPGRRSSLDSVLGPTSRMPLRWRHGCNERIPCFQTRRLKNAGADSYNGFGWEHPVAAGCVSCGRNRC